MLAAKFSLPFALATFIVNGSASVPAFRGEAQANATARDLARRVTVREDAVLTSMLPGLRPARVRVRLTDGRVLTAEVLTNKGDTEDPYSAVDVQDKFRELAEPVWGRQHAERIIAEVQRIDTASDIRGLTGFSLTPPKRVGHNEFQDTTAAEPGRRCAGRLRSAHRIPGSRGGLRGPLPLRRGHRLYPSPGGRISGSSP